MYSGFNNAPHLHTGDVSITELLRIRYELDLNNERDIQIVLVDYNGVVRKKAITFPCRGSDDPVEDSQRIHGHKMRLLRP